MQIAEIQKLAIQAYIAVLREHEVGWTAPPGDCKDRIWSRRLRELWPECTTVYMDAKFRPKYSEARTWAREHAGNHWCSANGDAWYFERRDLAALFKLTYGGSQHD